MTSTNDQKMRVVAEKLRMLGNTMPSPWELPYRLPSPPNFLEPAGADALMTALLAAQYFVHSRPGVCRISVIEGGQITKRIHGDGPNWREALLDAAYKLLGENVDGRH